jgi:hypothetical protein
MNTLNVDVFLAWADQFDGAELFPAHAGVCYPLSGISEDYFKTKKEAAQRSGK